MIKNIFGLVFSLLMSLFFLELFVNNARIETTSTTDFDKLIGRTRRANHDFTLFNEGFSMGSINKYGYLGPAYPPQRTFGTLRIVLLGDSYVESFQLFRRDQFHTVIEEKLSQSLGQPVEVLNFGRSGFDLADMYAYQQNFANKFHPDMVVYFLSEADLSCTQTDALIPKVILVNNVPEVTNTQMPKEQIVEFENTKFLTQNSAILQMLNNSRKLVKQGLFWSKMLDKFYYEKQTSIKTTVEPMDSIPVVALRIGEYLGDNVVVCNRGKEPLSDEFLEIIRQNQIPYLDINDTLNVLIQKGIDPNYWSMAKKWGHWNYKAHQAVGNYLSDHLELIIKENQDKYINK